MNKKNDGGPAFPCKAYSGLMQEGLSIRDHFAGLAMQGLLAAGRDAQYGEGSQGELSSASYSIADAMLVARNAK